MKTAHKDEFAEFNSQNEELKRSKAGTSNSKLNQAACDRTTATVGNIKSLLTVPKTWPKGSNEAVGRDEAFCHMFVMTGAPLAMAVNPAFKAFCKKLDPKYEVPGKDMSCQEIKLPLLTLIT